MFLNARNDSPIRSIDDQEQQVHWRKRALYWADRSLDATQFHDPGMPDGVKAQVSRFGVGRGFSPYAKREAHRNDSEALGGQREPSSLVAARLIEVMTNSISPNNVASSFPVTGIPSLRLGFRNS